VGINFHPLPPLPKDVLRWDDDEVAALVSRSLETLERSAKAYEGYADRLRAILPEQSEAQAPWVREIEQGLRVFGLRAAHAAEVYRTVLALRQALGEGDLDAIDVAYEGVGRAGAYTEAARKIIRAREREYRYPPELTITGGEAGTPEAEPNDSAYPYRYLSRTNRLFFWERPDKQLGELFGDGLELVNVNRRVLIADRPLEIEVLADSFSSLQIDYGDGAIETALVPHVYGTQGFYDWTLDATIDTGALHQDDAVAVVSRRIVFKKGSFRVAEPEGAAIMNGLLPGLDVGLGNDGSEFLAAGRIDDESDIAAQGGLTRRGRSGLSSGPSDWTLDLGDAGGVTVYDAMITLDEGSSATTKGIHIEGEIAPSQIVDIVVRTGIADHQGALELVAAVLDYTPETLPDRVDLIVNATGYEEL
jgi:hypothetical protein